MDTFARLVIAHRRLVLLLCLALTALGAWSASRARLSTNLGEQFLGDRPEHLRYRELSEAFVSDEAILVGLAGVDPLENTSGRRLRALVKELEALPEVDHVTSALDARRMRADDTALHLSAYVEDAHRRPAAREALRSEMQDDPFVRGAALSDDGRSTALAS